MTDWGLIRVSCLAGCQTNPLIKAACNGDASEVAKILGEGAKINEVSRHHSAVSCATYNNKYEVAKLLLSSGADPNIPNDGDSYSPLLYAAEYGLVDIARELIKVGANIDAPSIYGLTPLAQAAFNGKNDVVKCLIEAGADIDVALTSLDMYSISQNRTWINNQVPIAKSILSRYAEKKKVTMQFEPKVKHIESEMENPEITSDVDTISGLTAKTNKKAYAVVIGIEKYRQKLHRADYAASDAKTMTLYLTKLLGYPEENVVTLLNEQASKSDFEKYFEQWLKNNVDADSSVLVYYSGHGSPNHKTGDAYLVPYDGDPSFIDQTGYSLNRMYDALGKLPAKNVIVALDACFSGAGGKSVVAEGVRPLVVRPRKESYLPKNMVIMSASMSDQISSTYKEKGHGLFTYFLLRGIKDTVGEDNTATISVDDLYQYLKPQVQLISRKKMNNQQIPQLYMGDDKLKTLGLN